jgi:hypothetical protein
MITIEEVIKNNVINEDDKKKLLTDLEVLNSIAITAKLTSTLALELIPLVREHLKKLDNDPTLYNPFSMYKQEVLSVISAVTPIHCTDLD